MAGKIRFAGEMFDSCGLENYTPRSGSFVQGARGRWYCSIVVYYEEKATQSTRAVGIDLGLKVTATTSDGEELIGGKHYRKLEKELAIAQRAKNKNRMRSIYAKIRNGRKDEINKFISRLTKRYGVIFIGNVKGKALVKTKMAKSVLDAGWGMLKEQLKYKAIARSVVFQEINEAYTTQTCSCCGIISRNSPKGRAGLGIRCWICSSCGEEHDRDINAAKNILALGSGMTLSMEESPVF